MREIIYSALYLMLQLGILYFSVPYFTGQGLKDLSVSPIWEFVYYFISGIGTAIYRITERFFGFLADTIFFGPKKERFRTLILVLNVLYTGLIVYALLLFKDMLFGILFSGISVDLSVEDLTGGTVTLCNSLSLFELLQDFHSQEGLGFFASVWGTVSYTITYVLFYIITFSVVFGYLEHKVIELHPLSRFLPGISESGEDVEAEDRYTLAGTLSQLKSNLIEFLDNIAILTQFKKAGVLLISFLCCIALAFIKGTRSGYAPRGSFLSLLLENIGFYELLQTFLLVALFNLLVQLIIQVVIPKVIPAARRTIIDLSRWSLERIRSMSQSRERWANEHDYTRNFMRHVDHIRRMDLDRR